MSVSFTEQAVRERRKTVTRRKGWWEDSRGRRILKPGDHLTLCRKVMGRKPGEPLERICEVEVVSVRRESLMRLYGSYYGPREGYFYALEEVAREGFPGMPPAAFVRQFFTHAQGIPADADVTRIEWRYVCSPFSCECGGCVL